MGPNHSFKRAWTCSAPSRERATSVSVKLVKPVRSATSAAAGNLTERGTCGSHTSWRSTNSCGVKCRKCVAIVSPDACRGSSNITCYCGESHSDRIGSRVGGRVAEERLAVRPHIEDDRDEKRDGECVHRVANRFEVPVQPRAPQEERRKEQHEGQTRPVCRPMVPQHRNGIHEHQWSGDEEEDDDENRCV